MKYQIFLSDFDETLLRTDETISLHTRQVIARYREKGGIFAVCTGRGVTAILPQVRDLGITEGLVVAFQGATVVDIATGTPLKCAHYSVEEALEVTRFFEERNCHVHIYTVEDFYANREDEALRFYERRCKVKATLKTDEPLSCMIERENLAIIKVLVMGSVEECGELFTLAKEALGEKYFVTRSSDYLVEVMPKGQSKGEAVRFLSEYYSVPVEKIASIGDQLNDLPMLEVTGGKFTVENGADKLKEIATVVPSNNEEGVAYAIERYAMEETNE